MTIYVVFDSGDVWHTYLRVESYNTPAEAWADSDVSKPCMFGDTIRTIIQDSDVSKPCMFGDTIRTIIQGTELTPDQLRDLAKKESK